MGGIRHFVADSVPVGGLNAQTAAHLLPDGALQVAENADYSELGAVSNIASDSLLIAGTAQVDGIGCVSIDGVSRYIYKVDVEGVATVYEYNQATEDSTTLSAAWSSGRLRVAQGDNVAILSAGSLTRIWDGECLYKLGAPEATDDTGIIKSDYVLVQDPLAKSITGLSVSSGVVTVTAVAHGMFTGDKCWIESVGGATEANDRMYTVTRVTADTFTLDDTDGSTWGAYTSGGSAYVDACGLNGTYKYWLSNEITLPSDEVIEGSAVPMKCRVGSGGAEPDESITVTEKDRVTVYAICYKATDVSYWISGDYTVGTDLTVARKVYRSKLLDTAQPYLLNRFEHADIYVDVLHYASALDQTADADLGELWLPLSYDAHDAPPAFNVIATHAQRLYGSSGNNLYFSGLDGHNYFSPTDYLVVDEPITALHSVGDFLAVFSENGIWLYDPFNVSMKNMRVRFGVSDPEAVASFDGRVWYANNLGLYYLDTAQLGGFSVDAVQSSGASQPVDDLWRAAGPGYWALGSTHDTLYASCTKAASSKMFAMHMSEGGSWSTVTITGILYRALVSDARNNVVLFPSTASGIHVLGGGDGDKTLSIKSKAYVGKNSKASALMADVGADAVFTATVTTNAGKTTTADVVGGDHRSRVVVPLAGIVGDIFEVQFDGTGTIYGWILQVDELVETFF